MKRRKKIKMMETPSSGKEFIINEKDWSNIIGSFMNVTGNAGKGILYRAGFRTGNRISEECNLNKNNISKKIREIFSNLNWCKAKVDLENLTVMTYDSFESKAIGRTKESSCHFLSGVIAGLISSILKREYKVEEIECECKGDEICKFVLREAEWYERVSDLLETI